MCSLCSHKYNHSVDLKRHVAKKHGLLLPAVTGHSKKDILDVSRYLGNCSVGTYLSEYFLDDGSLFDIKSCVFSDTINHLRLINDFITISVTESAFKR